MKDSRADKMYEVQRGKDTFFKGRSIGKLTINKTQIKKGKTNSKNLNPLPRHQRLNPHLDPPEIGEKEMNKGLINLMNEG